MKNKTKKNLEKRQLNKLAIFTTISNPPTFGDIWVIAKLTEQYKDILILIYSTPMMMATCDVIDEMNVITSKFRDVNILIVSSPIDFSNVTQLPKRKDGTSFNKDADIITTSATVYTNLKSKNIDDVYFIKKPLGYKDVFHRIAFSRSLIYERIKKMSG